MPPAVRLQGKRLAGPERGLHELYAIARVVEVLEIQGRRGRGFGNICVPYGRGGSFRICSGSGNGSHCRCSCSCRSRRRRCSR